MTCYVPIGWKIFGIPLENFEVSSVEVSKLDTGNYRLVAARRNKVYTGAIYCTEENLVKYLEQHDLVEE